MLSRYALKLKIVGAVLFITLCTLFCFRQVTRFQYATFDDGVHLYHNKVLNPPSFENFKFIWTHPHNGYFAPVTYTFCFLHAYILNLNGKNIEESPQFFHKVNLLFHWMNAIWVFIILRRLFSHLWGAVFGALLFSLHPIQVETVAWISGMTGLYAAFFSFASIYFFIRMEEKKIFYPLAILFGLLALLSKPSAVCLPFVLLCIEIGFRDKKWKNSFLSVLPLFVFSIPILFITPNEQPGITFVTPWKYRPLLAVDTIFFYLGKFLFPFQLTLNYGRTPKTVVEELPIIKNILLLVISLGLFSFRRNKKVIVSAFAILVSVTLPVLGFLPYHYQFYSNSADRFVYFALLAPAFLIAFMYHQTNKVKVWKVGCVLSLFYLSVLNLRQGSFWKDDLTLVKHLVDIDPKAEHHYNLAELWSVEIEGRNPVIGSPKRPLAVPVTEADRLEALRQIEFHYRETVRLEAGHLQGWTHLAYFLGLQGRFLEGHEALNRVQKIEARYPEIYFVRGKLYRFERKWKEAELSFKTALKLDKDYVAAKESLTELMKVSKLNSY